MLKSWVSCVYFIMNCCIKSISFAAGAISEMAPLRVHSLRSFRSIGVALAKKALFCTLRPRTAFYAANSIIVV